MKTARIKSLVFLTVVGDVFFLVTSYLVVMTLKCLIDGVPVTFDADMMSYLPIAGVITFALMIIYEMYKNIFYRSKSDILATLGLIVFLSTILGVFGSYFLGTYVFSRSVLLYSGIYQWMLLTLWRVFIWNLRKSTQLRQKVLILGDLRESELMTEKFIMRQRHLFDIKYIVDKNRIESTEEVFKLINKVDHVLLGSNISASLTESISFYCMRQKKNVFMIPDIFSINLNNAKFIQVDDLPLFNVSRFGLSIDQHILKRFVDISVSLVCIILLIPVFIVLTIAIKIDSPGPILFRQERVTVNGKKFNIMKFRTMVKDAEKLTGPILATDHDPRITRLGNFMRATRLDEIPQLLNILAGSMSLVGPRPERQFFIDQILEHTPEFEYRTAVKAGVTGLGQVLGKYTTSPEDKLRYDLMYIKNYNIMLDMKILLKTIRVILSREASDGLKEDMEFNTYLETVNLWAKTTDYGYEIIRLQPQAKITYHKVGSGLSDEVTGDGSAVVSRE